MNIKELKDLIKDLPEDMSIIVAFEDVYTTSGESEIFETWVNNNYFFIGI